MDHGPADRTFLEQQGIVDPEGVITAGEAQAPVDEGATTAEYAITTLAACGFAALLVVILTSEPVRAAVEGIITTALSLGG